MNEDKKWMRLALNEALKAEQEGEVPVGAVLVKDGLFIAKAHNQPILTSDPTAHAEIQLLRMYLQSSYLFIGCIMNMVIYIFTVAVMFRLKKIELTMSPKYDTV